MTIDQQNNNKIDHLLQQRQDGMFNFAAATRDLLSMGLQVGSQTTGEILVPESFTEHLDKFNRSNLEFEWMATYKDGSMPIYQFGPGPNEEHHFKDIDQNKLKSVSFISNFNWQTDNQEKRVIATLDWETGIFSFLNGFISQDDLGKLVMEKITEPKKLILVIKRRQSPVVGDIKEDLKQFHGPIDEIFYYNRFLLGFETPSGRKRTILIQPNGNINLWEIS